MYINEKVVGNILPQKRPFRFVKDVIYVDNDEKILYAYQTFSKNDFFFEGHFPNEPIVPGVILTEFVAQSGLILLSKILNLEINIGYLVQTKSFTFMATIHPEEKIYVKSNLIKNIGRYYYINGTIFSYDSNKKIARGTVVLYM